MKLPLGYLYSATYAGIRAAEKDDLALIISGLPASAAATRSVRAAVGCTMRSSSSRTLGPTSRR